ncbi:hypothetical protein [Sphingomonas sp. Leaf230]|uniref:hypothetical protein n=1 Tax=Sphingomonas sp. Leaf230 TaxID=1735694 RepID=UPI000A52AE74|nr:hypothetical protein [Sphingomonas sp. Leaf230]
MTDPTPNAEGEIKNVYPKDDKAGARELVAQAKEAGVTFSPDPDKATRWQPTPDGDVGSYTDDDAIIRQKLIDAEIPGAKIEFDPAEADRAGAFVEDALSEEDARAAEEGLEPPAPAPVPTKGALFALARAKN